MRGLSAEGGVPATTAPARGKAFPHQHSIMMPMLLHFLIGDDLHTFMSISTTGDRRATSDATLAHAGDAIDAVEIGNLGLCRAEPDCVRAA